MSKKLEDFSLEEISDYLADYFALEVIADKLSNAFFERGEKCKKNNKTMHDSFKKASFILDDISKGKYDNEY